MSEFTNGDKILRDILKKAERMADKIHAPRSWIPVIRSGPNDDVPYYIEIDSKGLHLVSKDRGLEIARETTNNPDEVLYLILESITMAIATRFELEHRVKGQDFRCILFEKQEELLGELDPSWEGRRKKEHEEILKVSPFVADFD